MAIHSKKRDSPNLMSASLIWGHVSLELFVVYVKESIHRGHDSTPIYDSGQISTDQNCTGQRFHLSVSCY